MRFLKYFLFFLPLLAISLPVQGKDKEDVYPEKFARKLKALQPKAKDNLWKKIPWQTDILKARVLAARSGRPIFIWAMNGHPLGCT